jgi:hypothetical protein
LYFFERNAVFIEFNTRFNTLLSPNRYHPASQKKEKSGVHSVDRRFASHDLQLCFVQFERKVRIDQVRRRVRRRERKYFKTAKSTSLITDIESKNRQHQRPSCISQTATRKL